MNSTPLSLPWHRLAQGPPPPPPLRLRRYPFTLRRLLRQRHFHPGLLLSSLLTISFIILFWAALPYDSPVRLAVRFNFQQLKADFLEGEGLGVNWNADAKTYPWYPVNITTDVVVLLKTGYGTRGRVQAWFEANMPPKQEKNGMGFGEGNVLVVGDYASKPGKGFVWQGREFVVRDMAGKMLEDARNMLGEREVVKEKYPRVGKYEALRQAIEKGDEEQAMKLSKEWGWELDALKDLSTLLLAHTLFPTKLWYLLLDDDTFILRPSLHALLSRLDPNVPHYIGSPVGDYRARFAHGGSGVLLSRATLKTIFPQSSSSSDPRKALSAEVYRDALTIPWGDRLIAQACQRRGVYLDERYARLFCGEPPLMMRIEDKRLCQPALSFHKLGEPNVMREVGERFRNVSAESTGPVLWKDLWQAYYGQTAPWKRVPDAASLEGRKHWDYVGDVRPKDEDVEYSRPVLSARWCAELCDLKDDKCLAWRWDGDTGQCFVSPWVMLGRPAGESVVSGVNTPRLRRVEEKCQG